MQADEPDRCMQGTQKTEDGQAPRLRTSEAPGLSNTMAELIKFIASSTEALQNALPAVNTNKRRSATLAARAAYVTSLIRGMCTSSFLHSDLLVAAWAKKLPDDVKYQEKNLQKYDKALLQFKKLLETKGKRDPFLRLLLGDIETSVTFKNCSATLALLCQDMGLEADLAQVVNEEVDSTDFGKSLLCS